MLDDVRDSEAPTLTGSVDSKSQDQAEAEFAELLRTMWSAITRATRAMEHLPTLPGQHVEVLHRLTDSGGLTPAQLAVAMRLSRPTISELTRKMVDEGLIERVPSERDGRSVVLVPTDSAKRVLASFRHGVQEVVSAALDGIPRRLTRRLLADLPALTTLMEEVSRQADRAEAEYERGTA
jgi:DNA-binding MarR family transcriptional regulator